MISAFGVTHGYEAVSKARKHPDLPPNDGESGRAYQKRLSDWLKEDPSRNAGVVREASDNPAQPEAKPKAPKAEAPKPQPKPEVKVEAPKPEPKVEAPKPASQPGGTMGTSPVEAAQTQTKPERTVSRAYNVGQTRAFREGKGPIASALNGLKFASAAHPGKTAAVVGGTSAGLAGAAYVGGRAHQKKRDGQ